MQRFLVLGTVVLGLSAFAQGVTSAQSATSYSTYRNARFGYSVLYPAKLMSPRAESQNGDGRVFKSSDGWATLTVWGENNVSHRSLKEQMSAARRDWGKDKGRITYWKMGSGYYVLSGLTGREIFYEKTVPIRGGFATMLWQYPKSQKAKFDAAVTRSTRAFGTGVRVAQSSLDSQAKAPRVALDSPVTNARGY